MVYSCSIWIFVEPTCVTAIMQRDAQALSSECGTPCTTPPLIAVEGHKAQSAAVGGGYFHIFFYFTISGPHQFRFTFG